MSAISELPSAKNIFFEGFPGGVGASLVAQLVKNRPTMQDTWV